MSTLAPAGTAELAGQQRVKDSSDLQPEMMQQQLEVELGIGKTLGGIWRRDQSRQYRIGQGRVAKQVEDESSFRSRDLQQPDAGLEGIQRRRLGVNSEDLPAAQFLECSL